MARWQPARADVVAEYAREILDVHPRGRLVIGIDGVEWPGPAETPSARETFAADLAEALSAAGVPALAVPMVPDETDFRSRILQPYRAGETIAISRADPSIGRDGGWTTTGFTAPARAALVVSGAFLHTGDLAGIWHTSTWIRIPRAVARARDADRGIGQAALDDWYAGIDRGFRRGDARKLANATFDLTDPEHPRREFEDAC